MMINHLFDAIQVKTSAADTIAMRARRQAVAMSLITLAQGIPFYYAADDLLRSKDMDDGSYNSGDWFNKIDWSGNGNNWGIGLPIANVNQAYLAYLSAIACKYSSAGNIGRTLRPRLTHFRSFSKSVIAVVFSA